MCVTSCSSNGDDSVISVNSIAVQSTILIATVAVVALTILTFGAAEAAAVAIGLSVFGLSALAYRRVAVARHRAIHFDVPSFNPNAYGGHPVRGQLFAGRQIPGERGRY